VRAKLQALFDSALTDTGGRRGCFLCNASTEVQAEDEDTRVLVRQVSDQLCAVFAQALQADAAFAADPARLAAEALHLHAGYVGLRVLIKAGLTEAEARVLVDRLLAGL
jgi:TetR/AcrR family transcriptional regulator, transcriptional repressor for nem operon